MDNLFVIKIGGSTFSTSEEKLFDFEQANKLKETFKSLTEKGFKFILVTGGGFIARKYQKMIREAGLTDYDEHYAGTAINNLNATLLRGVFGDLAEEKIVAFSDFDKKEEIKFSKPILIAGAGHPGPSGDWDASYLAKYSNANKVISLKDIDGVYSADPDLDPTATKVENLTWDEYLNIIGNPEAHKPGGNLPVDPLASKFSKENGVSFVVLNGNDLNNFVKAISGEAFVGSTIN